MGFKVTRHGEPIDLFFLSGSVSTGIRLSLAYEGWDACIAAGLDLERWDEGEYPILFMAKVIAWHRLKRLITSHTDAAIAQASAKKAKQK